MKGVQIASAGRWSLIGGDNSCWRNFGRLGWIPDTTTGAFYVFLKYRNPKKSLELALEILEKTGVALTPGVDFGQGGEGFLRFSYANSAENLGIAVDRLVESGLL